MDVDRVYQATQQEIRARAAAAAGNVSDPGYSAALDLSAERTRGAGEVANMRQRNVDQVRTGTSSSNFLAANNALAMAASDAKRQSDQWNALKDIGDERTKLRLDRAAKTSAEVARLLDQEIAKANANREFDVARQKLLGDRAELRADMQQWAAEFGLEKKKHKHKVNLDKANLRLEEIDRILERGRLNETRRHNLVQERQRLQELIDNRAEDREDRGKNGGQDRDDTAWRAFRGLLGQARTYGTRTNNRGKLQQLLSLENKNADPLLVQAAVELQMLGGVSPQLARQINRLYGFKPKVRSTGRRGRGGGAYGVGGGTGGSAG
jgi:hypothetical protein